MQNAPGETTMHSVCLPQPIRRPWPLRWLEAASDALSRLRQRHQYAINVAAAVELSEQTLRDIGAPDELLREAAARREADYLRAAELRLGFGRGATDRGAW
jgi:hypothetical protein